MSHLEQALRSFYTPEQISNWTDQPQPKDWADKTEFERDKAEDNKFEEFRVIENAYKNHTMLYKEVYAKGSDRYASLLETSPSFKSHSKCSILIQKGYDKELKNAEKYLMQGVLCFAEVTGNKSASDVWKQCVARNFGDHDMCKKEFMDLENAVAKKMRQWNQMTVDPKMAEIAKSCVDSISIFKLTPQKDFLASMACVAPKYCPALYRELSQCYHENEMSTKRCRVQARNMFACINDFQFRKSERFFARLDNLNQPEILHPAVPKSL